MQQLTDEEFMDMSGFDCKPFSEYSTYHRIDLMNRDNIVTTLLTSTLLTASALWNG